jgi:ankyrin repeat protein
MNTMTFMKNQSFFISGLFALILYTFGFSAWGQPTKPQDPLSLTMWIAAIEGHTEMVKMLLDRGAKIDLVDSAGRTALMYAASGPFAPTVRVLIDRAADVNVRDTAERFTALMFAAAEGQVEVIEVLLYNGADTTIKDKDNDTALDFAEKNGHQEAVKLLKKK